MSRKIDHLMSLLLDAVDESPDGVNLDECRKVFCQNMPFAHYVYGVNRLMAMGLITIDSNHIAHRVRS